MSYLSGSLDNFSSHHQILILKLLININSNLKTYSFFVFLGHTCGIQVLLLALLSGNHMGFQGVNQGLLHARHISYLLYYHSHPKNFIFKKLNH